MTMGEYLIELYLAGHDSFGADQAWLKTVTGVGDRMLFCPNCHNIYERIRRVDAVVGSKRRRTDMDLIAGGCGRVQVLSTQFIDLVGPDLVEKTASLGRLRDEAGREHERYRTALCRNNSVVVRGLHGS